MSETISLAKVRENALDFLECASEADMLAFVEAVEAAELVKRELLWGDTRTSIAYERLGSVLNRFDFAEPS
jgi:hypothetical protein